MVFPTGVRQREKRLPLLERFSAILVHSRMALRNGNRLFCLRRALSHDNDIGRSPASGRNHFGSGYDRYRLHVAELAVQDDRNRHQHHVFSDRFRYEPVAVWLDRQIFAPVPISLYSGLLYVLLLHARYERDQAIDRRLYLHLLATLYPATANRPLCGDHSDCGAVSPFCSRRTTVVLDCQPEVPRHGCYIRLPWLGSR